MGRARSLLVSKRGAGSGISWLSAASIPEVIVAACEGVDCVAILAPRLQNSQIVSSQRHKKQWRVESQRAESIGNK